MMIPLELLPVIATHLSPSGQASPVMFEIPLSYQLHRVITVPLCPPLPIPTSPLSPLPQFAKAPRTSSTSLVNLFWSQRFMRKAFMSSASLQPPTGTQATSYTLSVSSTVRAQTSTPPCNVTKKAMRPNSVSLSTTPRHLTSAEYSNRMSLDSEKVDHNIAQ